MVCVLLSLFVSFGFFFFNDTATTEIYTLSLHDALPIFAGRDLAQITRRKVPYYRRNIGMVFQDFKLLPNRDRKSTRLNSSHANISYAVFCLKKKITHHIAYSSLPLHV